MKFPSISILVCCCLPMIVNASATIEKKSASASAGAMHTNTGSRTLSTPAERTRGRLRNLGVSSLVSDPLTRHDGAIDESSDQPPAGTTTTTTGQTQPQPPRQNGGPARPPRDVFDRDPNVSALGRHDDDPIGSTGGSQRQQDTTSRHSDTPGERDVGGQFTLPPTENQTPSEQPSSSPSYIPSQQPSASPAPSSHSPSMPPSGTPSASDVPSLAPSTNARNLAFPSAAPSTMPSGAPSFNCNADDAGFFGNSGLKSVVVTYKYEMEYRPIPNMKEVFDAIEKQASDSVLPRLFEALCTNTGDTNTTDTTDTADNNSDNTTTRMLVGGQGRRRLAVSGVSPRPDDVIDPTAVCAVPVSSTNFQCNVTDGAITVFLNDTENGEADIVLFAIRDAMTAGEFNDIHEAIERISFRNETEAERPDNTGPGKPKSGGSSDNGFPVWAYVLIALGCLMFIGLGFFVWRRRQTREAVKDTDTRDDDYNDGMEELDESGAYQPPDTMSRLTTQHEEEGFPVQHEEEDYDDYEEDTRQG